MIDLPFKQSPTDRRVIALLVVGLVVLFGGLYVAGYVVTGDKVPRGTTVSGVDIGGLKPASARVALRRELGPLAQQPIRVVANDRRGSIRPDEAGLAVDYDASVAQAGGGRSLNPGRMWDYFSGGDNDLEAVVTVDEAALDAALEKFGKKVHQRAVEGRIRFEDGQAKARYPRTGRALDQDAAADVVVDAFLQDNTEPVPLEVTEVEPDVPDKKVRAAMDEFANPAMSAPVILVMDNQDVVVRPEAYSDALSMRPKDGSLVPRVDRSKLVAAIESSMKEGLTPKPATVRLVNGEPKVVPGKDGVTFDPQKVKKAFLSLVVQPDNQRTLEVETVVDHPDFTTDDARGLGIKEAVSSFTTHFPHSDYRNTNLGRAAELVNGTVLKPGETFSLNDTVGERTAENGFTEGYIIQDGVYKEDFGGGVSQVATTLFNGAFFAGLEDVEHKPHSFYIDRYPIGREATVAWGAVDLKFRNDTPHGVLIQAWIEPSTPSTYGSMNVRFWSTKYWDIEAGVSKRYNITKEKTRYIRRKDCVPNEGYGGFDIDVYRFFRRPGSDEVERKETMHTTYTPSDTVVCRRNPDA